MKKKMLIRMGLTMVLTLSVKISSSAQEEVVPSKRGSSDRRVNNSKNCQLNSLAIKPTSFREGDRINVKVVIVCNQPLDRAVIFVRHVPEKRRAERASKLSQKIVAL